MTREEAINLIKQVLPCLNIDEKIREGFETLIPELKESEDEKIRKEIIEEIEFIIPHDDETDSEGLILPSYHARIDRYKSYLEKQKEQPITANDLDEEIHRFFDDCIDVHEVKLYGNISERVIPVDCYEITARHFAKWGEKQKEPHFTKRNALFDKCVENCDPEIMKRVSDEVDEMLEKEQKLYWKPTKTDVALLNKAIITNNTLTSTEREQLDIIRSRFGYCRASNCNGIVQEKPNSAECSDDERIREDIVALIKFALNDGSAVSPGSYTTKEEALAYLEKQKKESLRDFIDNFPYSAEQEEQDWNKKPCLTCQEYEKGHKQGYTEGCTAGYNKAMKEMEQKEQKPAEQLGGTFTSYDMAKTFTEGQNYVIAHPEKFGLCKPAEWSEEIIQKAVKEVGLTQHQIDWFKTNVFPPKVEWSEEDEERIQSILFSVGYCKDEYPNKKDYSKDIAWLKALPLSLKKRNEAAEKLCSNEWSEEDEGELQNAIDALEFLGKKGVYKSESGYDAALQAAFWLKDLHERFNLQSKQEWSEEDEKDIAHIVRILDDCYAYGKHDLSKTDHENLVGTLKSLRIRSKQSDTWKPSEGPVWRIWQNGACGNSDGTPIAIVKEGYTYRLVSCLGAGGEKYIMLSDLEKLPGFDKR